jgi:hypothetical protein
VLYGATLWVYHYQIRAPVNSNGLAGNRLAAAARASPSASLARATAHWRWKPHSACASFSVLGIGGEVV